jgi:hypothetical protein
MERSTTFFPRTNIGNPCMVEIHPRVDAVLRPLWLKRGRPQQGHVFLTIRGCTNDVVTRFEGRPLDLCAIGQVDLDAKFTPAAISQPRKLTIIVETMSQSRWSAWR